MTKSQPDPRQGARETLLINAKIRREGDGVRKVTVRNLSVGGMMLDGFDELSVDDAVVAEIPGIGKIEGVIAWTEGGRAGMAFAQPVDPSQARRPRLKAV